MRIHSIFHIYHTAVLVIGLFHTRFVENFRGNLACAEEVKTLEWGRSF